MSKDDFMETMKDLQFLLEKDPVLVDGYKEIDSKLKTQLTKAYNSGEHRLFSINLPLISMVIFAKQ